MSEDFLPAPFSCDVTQSDGTARVHLSGELDMSTVPMLEERLAAVREAGARRIVVDLRALEFMDSTGLTLFTRWSLGAEGDGYAFALVPGDDRIQRLFELTGLNERLTFISGYRLTFQDVVGPTAIGAVEELTGRKVVGYHGQVVFEPFRAFEIFVLETQT